jgi:hypothetical protein
MKIVSISLLGLCLFACISKTPQAIDQCQWLLGKWMMEGPEGTFYETWTKENEKELKGTSYFLKAGDTLYKEQICLIQEGEQFFYIPSVSNQNEGKAIRFTAIALSETELLFENKTHDFPQRISYRPLGVDSLLAEVSGIVPNKGEHKEGFPMKRIP